jgi:DDE superfamily endonuclease
MRAAPITFVAGLPISQTAPARTPMAKRLALGECDQLHYFIAAGVWDARPVETELLIQANRLVGGSDAVLVIDDTAIPMWVTRIEVEAGGLLMLSSRGFLNRAGLRACDELWRDRPHRGDCSDASVSGGWILAAIKQ